MRNQRLKEFRERLKSTSRFFLGYIFILYNSEIVLFKEVFLCRVFQEYDFARTVNVATEKVELKEGPLEQFTHEMEPYLRKQGLPVRLKKGVIGLVSDLAVCEQGMPLSSESARNLLTCLILDSDSHCLSSHLAKYHQQLFPEQLCCLP
uniref:Large ribosomal subunit protein uL10-like insertion domain-containing protein n=1 Tax=Musa acuminata subsp. malaccensis TaxID=214687 RepID=A0A804IRF2_MUSAM